MICVVINVLHPHSPHSHLSHSSISHLLLILTSSNISNIISLHVFHIHHHLLFLMFMFHAFFTSHFIMSMFMYWLLVLVKIERLEDPLGSFNVDGFVSCSSFANELTTTYNQFDFTTDYVKTRIYFSRSPIKAGNQELGCRNSIISGERIGFGHRIG